MGVYNISALKQRIAAYPTVSERGIHYSKGSEPEISGRRPTFPSNGLIVAICSGRRLYSHRAATLAISGTFTRYFKHYRIRGDETHALP